jgi:acetoacetate decarboxylase
MHGQLWMSLFRVREGDHPDRDPGVYGVALVAYEDPSPLTYSELLVARPVRAGGGRHVNITDIWVDSTDSRDGGRDLWAIPKGLCDFGRTTDGGRAQRTAWSTAVDGGAIASARFSDVSALAPRMPFRGSTWQTRASGEEVVARLGGSTRVLPCRGSWDFDAKGPLAWLAGKRPLASFRMRDFSMSFG